MELLDAMVDGEGNGAEGVRELRVTRTDGVIAEADGDGVLVLSALGVIDFEGDGVVVVDALGVIEGEGDGVGDGSHSSHEVDISAASALPHEAWVALNVTPHPTSKVRVLPTFPAVCKMAGR
ncbi:MAG: hypothetical protein LAT55_13210 [Opitutales bacterium]|nr:hypothetical protein [Opitutales bacterium]